jgi:cyclopropane-fatty-acyl-phospholipid synthase
MAEPTVKTTDRNIEITLSLLDDLLGSCPLHDLAVRLWDGTIWKPPTGSGEPARCTLVLRHPGALRRMLLPPSELKLGEAYIYNDFDIEGEIEVLLPLVEYLLGRRWRKVEQLRYGKRLLGLPKIGQPRPSNVTATLRGRPRSKERVRRGVAYHYDLSNDLFALMLDSRMVYSCAYFTTPDDDLETAQEYKLDYVCCKLRLQSGERLLDLGCGWGALIIYAAQHYGVEADGVTLSAQQAEVVRERIKEAGLEDRCRISLCDYREVNKPQGYDKLVSVEMDEHVGQALLPIYFKCAWELLRPGGVFLNHGIGVHSNMPVLGLDFVHRHVSPYVQPVPISTTLRAAEAAGFGVRDVENLKDHYVYTLRHWLRRLEEHADEAKRIAGEITYRSLRLLYSMALHEAAVGAGSPYQTLLVKPENGRTGLPLRREDWYA